MRVTDSGIFDEKMNKAPLILLAEDEAALGSSLKRNFEHEGFTVDWATTGTEAADLIRQKHYALCILDVNLPGENGFSLCRRVREGNKETPVIFLTAFGELEDKLHAFQEGADDYIVKPFFFEELLARIKVFLKRSELLDDEDKVIEIADLRIDPVSKAVSRAGKEINLTLKEFDLLLALARKQGVPVSKREIMQQVWGLNFETGTNTIEVYINFLRNKIDKNFDVKLIHTRPGFGYFLKVPEA